MRKKPTAEVAERAEKVFLCVLGALGGCFCAVVFGLSVSAPDWPQFLGPQRNGVYTGPPLAASWPAAGPMKWWQKTIGTGFAGPVVAADRWIPFHPVNDDWVFESFAARTWPPAG